MKPVFQRSSERSSERPTIPAVGKGWGDVIAVIIQFPGRPRPLLTLHGDNLADASIQAAWAVKNGWHASIRWYPSNTVIENLVP
jgi:hypothetical protein